MKLTVSDLISLAPQMPKDKAFPALLILDTIVQEYSIVTDLNISSFLTYLIIQSNQFRKGRENFDVNIKGMTRLYDIYKDVIVRKFKYKQQSDDYQHKAKELCEFWFYPNKDIGNTTEGDGYLYRPAFYHRRIGKTAIEEMIRLTIEYQLEYSIPNMGDMHALSKDEFCEHLLPNILSVAENWQYNQGNQFAAKGHIGEFLVRFSDHGDQQRKCMDLMNRCMTIFQEKSAD